jgi:methylenetetrahydrofolate--tRNA-(uracil-5-)-methyltransferase
MTDIIVIGGGLAGSEAAWQAAERGLSVCLYEMRPAVATGAHTGGDLAELVCSNSLGSTQFDRAPGLLKAELRRMGSLLLRLAEETAVPAGGALAVDRDVFARRVTEAIAAHPRIELRREEMRQLPDGPCIVASGPLTSPALSQAIAALTGQEHLYFFDAIAPVVLLESINFDRAFRASRYARGEQEAGDYINCPLNKEEYEAFVGELVRAERIALKDFEVQVEQGVKAGADHFFEGCLPVEVLARRGLEALSYGPMRPVGLRDPRTGHRPYAVLQLRQDNIAGTLYNLVGFQTNLTFSEQKRVLRMAPGLEQAEFARYGQMHRNTFIFSPAHLLPSLQHRLRPELFFAGQITGVEGYAGNIATGLLAGWNAARYLQGATPVTLPPETMLGALCHYITHAAAADFQPMKANYGIMPSFIEGERPRNKRDRMQAYSKRAMAQLEDLLQTLSESNAHSQ